MCERFKVTVAMLWVGCCMDGCMDGWMNGWVDGSMYVCMYVCMYVWVGGALDG